MGFDTLLIANRGEIAVRVARTARRMGLRTVAVYSSADAGAPHVAACDAAVEIGPPAAAESYLDTARILEAARRTGADAIHPGYGFLSENAAFAQACQDAGLIFVGPLPRAITDMGDKAAAKRLMRRAGVPVVPGYDDADQSDERLIAEAERIGFPIMVKAAAGGGGKGMRLVTAPAALRDALTAARRESQSAFGSGVLLLERAVQRPRHVEIQVLADSYGHTIHLGERDCSVQRRHQKVLEEAPSPAVNDGLRERMGAAGVAAARAVDYVGAGTVEFLLDDSGGFYFLEMNTRLQVEHPVTEMVTGLDLVEWQLRVARGERLDIQQDDVCLSGHAIEARLYAEDAANDFLPATGTILRWETPDGEGVRIDSGVTSGTAITAYYDPMIAKVICHGDDREQARKRLVRTLAQTTALGTTTNRAMLIATLEDPTFATAQATTALLVERPFATVAVTSADIAAVAAWNYGDLREAAAVRTPRLAGWSSSGRVEARMRLAVGDDVHVVTVTETADGVVARVGNAEHQVVVGGELPLVDGIDRPLRCVRPAPGRILASFETFDIDVTDLGAVAPGDATLVGEGVLLAPMHGRVIAVEAAAGGVVAAGQRLVVLEAMKMEHEIIADIDGVVGEIVSLGAQVATDQILARIASRDGG